MSEIKYRETMWAELEVDVYVGPNCDEHRPIWSGGAEGDNGGPERFYGPIMLEPGTFPPGTKVVVSVPVCPSCGTARDIPLDMNAGGKCDCGFDWRRWDEGQYS